MEASPQGLMALTAGGVEWPVIGAPMHDLNSIMGPTCAGLRWQTGDTVVFAFNPDGNIRVNNFDLVTSEVRTLRYGGFNDCFAGGDVVATFSDMGFWSSNGQGQQGGNQRAVAVDDASGAIAFMREDRSGLDAYVGNARVHIFDGAGNYGASFKQRVLHFLAPGKRMYRWVMDTNTLTYLFDLPPWLRPICQYSGGWFLGWHDNIGGVVIWHETDLEHGRIATQGIEANDPRIIRVGDEIHVLSASGAGELLHEGQRRILPLNDLNLWPIANLMDPQPPTPPDPPVPPVEDVMYPSVSLNASGFETFWEDPKRWVFKGANNGRYLTINQEWESFWKIGVNGPGGGIESDSAFDWVRGEPFAYVRRNGGEFKFPVNVKA